MILAVRAMIGRGAVAIIAPLLLLGLAGCSDAPGEQQKGPPPNPLLYEIASSNGAVEGWMLGTIHALPDGTEWQTPAISRVAGDADFLVVEIAALGDGDKVARTFSALARTPGLPPLDARLPAGLRPQLAAMLERGDMDAGSFTETETWAAALMLARIDAEGDPANGVDRALIGNFASGKVRELEGAAGQLAIFDTLPENVQRTLLAAVVTDAQAARARAGQLRKAWLTGDEAKLEAANTTGIMADPALREALLLARNRRWEASIAAMLEEPERPLVAVGTAHLVGPDGLVASMRARGYRVTRIP
jgi:uncharacterized protein YbaP (TraB family)